MADIEKSNEAGIIPASGEIVTNFPPPPEQMTDEALAGLVRDTFVQLKRAIPYITELRQRFAKKVRGHAGIMGCRTWEEFCENVLDRTPSAVRKALSAAKKEPEKPKLFLAALKQVLPMTDRVAKIGGKPVRFSRAENGNILLTTQGPYGIGQTELPVPAPTKCTCSTLLPERPNVIRTWPAEMRLARCSNYIASAGGPWVDEWVLPVNAPDHGEPELFAPPFECGFDIRLLMDFLNVCEGDPTCVLYRPADSTRAYLVMWETEHGQLRFEYDAIDLAIAALATRTQKWQRTAEWATRNAAEAEHAAQPYTGTFLPDLKAGDEVTIEDLESEHLRILPVDSVTNTEIVVCRAAFNRETAELCDAAGRFRILRLATQEDRDKVEEQKALDEIDRAEQQRANEAKREDDARKRAEVEAFYAESHKLTDGTKFRIDAFHTLASNSADWSVGVRTDVTLEELKKIVDALKPEPVTEETKA
jgi:hypothetical protein